ncbi:hypothetical protein MBLNU459_g3771t2 [Dothideomycetes sp. NU459]
MGSIVLDAVNHFFHPPSHASDSTDPFAAIPGNRSAVATPPSFSKDRASTQTPMSGAGSRAGSSQDSTTARRGEKLDEAAEQQQTGPQRPGSPTITASDPDKAALPEFVQSDTSSERSSPLSGSSSASTPRIKVRDLSHIQSLVEDDQQAFSGDGYRIGQKSGNEGPQYEISGMPIENIIEMVAGLLTKITTTNDRQHEHLHRQLAPPPEAASTMSPQTNSVLAFHGKNVPSITILSYLNRINKYCPTSYEVFLSLLVYFDRMTEKVNAVPMQNLREMNQHAAEHSNSQQREKDLKSPSSAQSMEGLTPTVSGPTQMATPPQSGEYEKQSQGAVPGTPHSRPHHPDSPAASYIDTDALSLSHFFVVDSFNIHRLVIAGVTCASKFFSDIFYTNSRYAKVGGLPLPELNHLELQFLLLNDFRLSVPVEELEAYGTMLVEFYAREILTQQRPELDMDSLAETANSVKTAG